MPLPPPKSTLLSCGSLVAAEAAKAAVPNAVPS